MTLISTNSLNFRIASSSTIEETSICRLFILISSDSNAFNRFTECIEYYRYHTYAPICYAHKCGEIKSSSLLRIKIKFLYKRMCEIAYWRRWLFFFVVVLTDFESHSERRLSFKWVRRWGYSNAREHAWMLASTNKKPSQMNGQKLSFAACRSHSTHRPTGTNYKAKESRWMKACCLVENSQQSCPRVGYIFEMNISCTWLQQQRVSINFPRKPYVWWKKQYICVNLWIVSFCFHQMKDTCASAVCVVGLSVSIGTTTFIEYLLLVYY